MSWSYDCWLVEIVFGAGVLGSVGACMVAVLISPIYESHVISIRWQGKRPFHRPENERNLLTYWGLGYVLKGNVRH